MSAFMYDSSVVDFVRGDLDWESAPVQVMLVTDDYQPSQASDESLEQVRSFEVSPSGTYLAGGGALAERSVVRGGVGQVRLLGGTVRWGGFTGQFRYAVVHADGRLIACTDLGRQEATNARVLLEYDRDGGVAEFSVAPAL